MKAFWLNLLLVLPAAATVGLPDKNKHTAPVEGDSGTSSSAGYHNPQEEQAPDIDFDTTGVVPAEEETRKKAKRGRDR